MREMAKSMPKRSSHCASDLLLDALVGGQAQTSEEAKHFKECTRCRERLALFRDAESLSVGTVENLLRAAKAQTQAPGKPELGWFTWPRFAVATSACALAFVLLFVVQASPSTTTVAMNDSLAPGDHDQVARPADGVRAKGTSIRFFRYRDGQVTRGQSGDRLRTGDALRFTVTTGQATNFFLIGVEDSGKVSAYHPFNGSRSVRLAPGVDMPLPDSLVLDDSRDAEHFVGIFSSEPIEFENLVRLLADDIGEHNDVVSAIDRLPFPGTRHLITIRREP